MNGEGNAYPTVRVAIIDDHDVVHAGVEAWCSQADPPIKVIGNFKSPREFFAAFPDLPTEDVDVVVIDPQLDGNRPEFHTLRKLCDAGQCVVVYSDMSADEVILTSLDFGAVTYLVKSEGKRHLIAAIEAACTEVPYVGPTMAKALATNQLSGRIKLSEREKQVLLAWFQTESKDLVAKRLYIAPATVRTHLQRARAKYAAVGRPAPTKSALLARAIEDGILSLNDL